MNYDERLKFLNQKPRIEEAAFVAHNATIIGDVSLGKDSSIWYGAVLRADIESITIGEGTNLQDSVIVHLDDKIGTHVGKYNTVGHGAILHACTIGDECLIGMGATVMDGAVIGNQCVIGANSFVPKGFKIPDGMLVYGSPAKIIRPLKEEEKAELKMSAENYIKVARAHAAKQSS